MNEKIFARTREEILDGVLAQFEQLAKIPRPSKHEKQISDFLKKFFAERGFEVVQDENNNLIAEIPASAGKESLPLTILQAHMDMVCVAAEGYSYEPTRDPIKLLRDEKFLSAEGTSLGADDGIGVASILYLVDNCHSLTHGPLRIIFTVCEELAMIGADKLDKKFFSDAAYLINCDAQTFGKIVMSCAGCSSMTFQRELHYVRPDTKLATSIAVEISGLRGGHSGAEISAGRINAIKVAVKIMRDIIRRGKKVRLASISGGKAANVIPDAAQIVIATDMSAEGVQELCQEATHQLKRIYGAAEPNIKIEASTIDRPEKVLHAKDYDCLTNFISLVHSGVYLTAPENPAQVLASTNLGIVQMNDDIVKVTVMSRANDDALLTELIDNLKQAAQLCAMECKFSDPSPAWVFNPDNKLLHLAEEIFTRQNGYAPAIKFTHTGVEAGFLSKKNPAMDIISIGTTNENIHSPNERLQLDTVAPFVLFLAALLEKIAEA